MGSPEELLTEGLLSGYACSKKPTEIWRSCFPIKPYKFINSSDGIYKDEYIADRVGGGQELAIIDNKTITRVYAGGTITHEQLKELGITKKDVTKYLKEKILELKGRTRLHEDCNPEPDGDWQYNYQILKRLEEIPLTIGVETINFKDRRVFAHSFSISPIE